MNIVFMGTPDFAVPSLVGLLEKGYDISVVVTQPDRPKGRGKKMQYPPVKEVALKHNTKVYQPQKAKETSFIEAMVSLNPDVIVVIAYGQILPKEILSIPKKGCINVHASLLPKYRGAAPINWAIIKNETKTGVTTMYMDEGLDTGDMILKEEVEIPKDMTAGQLHDRLADVGKEILLDTLKLVQEDRAPRVKQNHAEHTYAPMLDKKLGEIHWNQSAEEIVNLIRGVNPWPGAYTFLGDQKVKVWKAKVYEKNDKESKPGTVLKYIPKEGLIVKTGDGTIAIEEIQMPNSKKMHVDSYMNGHTINIGTLLGAYGSV